MKGETTTIGGVWLRRWPHGYTAANRSLKRRTMVKIIDLKGHNEVQRSGSQAMCRWPFSPRTGSPNDNEEDVGRSEGRRRRRWKEKKETEEDDDENVG